jgi:hypothetical protein
MKDFASKQVKYFCNYADAFLAEFKKIRYGISSCCPKEDVDLITMRYELATWQMSDGYSTISEVKKKYGNLIPYTIEDTSTCFVNVTIVKDSAQSFKIDPAQSIWVLDYDLPFTPNVMTTDLNGQEIQGTVQYINSFQINVVFSSPVSGWAYLS